MPAPRALPAPQEPIVLLTETLVQRALEASRASDRQRVIAPFHKHHDDNPHRMFNAMQPATYVRPHRHLAVPKSEVFLVLRGALDFVVFREDGAIELACTLRAGSEQFGVDLAPGLFHGILVREPDTLVYEVKPGPYAPSSDKDFASWAPAEGDPSVPAYLAELEAALARYRA
jgi:cupin fold WbuC family metalloprotein